MLAHQVVPGELAGAWSWDPALLAALAGAAVAYGWAVTGARHPRRGRRAASFYAALGLLVVALLSPLDALASATFSAHMVQHLLLMLVAAPLLVAGRPVATVTPALPARLRRVVGQSSRRLRGPVHRLEHPVAVGLTGVLVLWTWHMPSLYEAALRQDAVHALEHASFLGAALLFWSVVLTSGRRRGVSRPVAVFLVFVTGVQSTALGAVLVFASTVLYPAQTAGAPAWGLAPLEDQRLAGALMWVPPAIVYIVVMAVLLGRWFSEMPPASPPEAADERAEPVLIGEGG